MAYEDILMLNGKKIRDIDARRFIPIEKTYDIVTDEVTTVGEGEYGEERVYFLEDSQINLTNEELGINDKNTLFDFMDNNLINLSITYNDGVNDVNREFILESCMYNNFTGDTSEEIIISIDSRSNKM